MSILTQRTQLESDRLATEADVLNVAEAAHYLASVQKAVFARFWNRSEDRILAELNSDPAQYAAMLGGNTTLGVPINLQLDALGLARFAHRAPVTMPAHWSFDPQTGFAYTPPIEPEPEPEPEP